MRADCLLLCEQHGDAQSSTFRAGKPVSADPAVDAPARADTAADTAAAGDVVARASMLVGTHTFVVEPVRAVASALAFGRELVAAAMRVSLRWLEQSWRRRSFVKLIMKDGCSM